MKYYPTSMMKIQTQNTSRLGTNVCGLHYAVEEVFSEITRHSGAVVVLLLGFSYYFKVFF